MLRFSLIATMILTLFPGPTAAASWLKLPHRSATPAATSKKATNKQRARVEKDVQRLESLLANVKTSANLSAKSWRSAANEANTLADRIYVNVKSATGQKDTVRAAEQLRTHVQNMKKEADKGDYRQTKRHADRALSVAAHLDEWAG